MSALPEFAKLQPEQMLTIAQLAAYTGIPRATIYTWRCREPEKLPKPTDLCGYIPRYKWGDVQVWEQEQKLASAE